MNNVVLHPQGNVVLYPTNNVLLHLVNNVVLYSMNVAPCEQCSAASREDCCGALHGQCCAVYAMNNVVLHPVNNIVVHLMNNVNVVVHPVNNVLLHLVNNVVVHPVNNVLLHLVNNVVVHLVNNVLLHLVNNVVVHPMNKVLHAMNNVVLHPVNNFPFSWVIYWMCQENSTELTLTFCTRQMEDNSLFVLLITKSSCKVDHNKEGKFRQFLICLNSTGLSFSAYSARIVVKMFARKLFNILYRFKAWAKLKCSISQRHFTYMYLRLTVNCNLSWCLTSLICAQCVRSNWILFTKRTNGES